MVIKMVKKKLGYRVEEALNPKAKHWRVITTGGKRKNYAEAMKWKKAMKKANPRFYYRVKTWKR